MTDQQPSRNNDEPANPEDESLDPSGTDSDARDEETEELSLEDLGAVYARVAAQHDPELYASPSNDSNDSNNDSNDGSGGDSESDPHDNQTSADHESESADDVATPEAIIEAALFIGHPENKSMSEQRLASLMRGVTPEEVIALIAQLNQSYRDADQAIRIVQDEGGYRMTIAPEVEQIRRSFVGKVREARLSQMAIEVLALVAYQPGITAQKVQDQRGRDGGSLLNQLVRRQLVRFERIKPEDGGRAIPHYYTTERFLNLFGLESPDDLPHVEEDLRET